MAKLSIKDAAERLGVSEITVRRRLHHRELEGEQEETPQGFRWLVIFPDSVEDDDATEQADSSAPDQSITLTVDHELLTELRGQVAYLKQEVEDRKHEHSRDRDDWRGELERLHTLMAQQGQTLQALTRTVETMEALPAGRAGRQSPVIHQYTSQIPAVVASIVGWPAIAAFLAAIGIAIASFANVDSVTARWFILTLSLVAITALVAMNRLSKRVLAIDEESRKDPAVARRHLRLATVAASLYVLGVVLVVVVSVLYLLN